MSWGLDLLQVNLTSFLASGAGFLGRQAAKLATRSREVGRRTFLKVYFNVRIRLDGALMLRESQ